MIGDPGILGDMRDWIQANALPDLCNFVSYTQGTTWAGTPTASTIFAAVPCRLDSKSSTEELKGSQNVSVHEFVLTIPDNYDVDEAWRVEHTTSGDVFGIVGQDAEKSWPACNRLKLSRLIDV